MTQDEWNELKALKSAISDHPASVHPDKMQRFTELLVLSLHGKGDTMQMNKEPSNY